jgi:hypothetical protein
MTKQMKEIREYISKMDPFYPNGITLYISDMILHGASWEPQTLG